MARNVEIKARVNDFEEIVVKLRELASHSPVELRQSDTFFHCESGRLKLRDLLDGTGELIFYVRGDQAAPKTSTYVRSATSHPGTLRECLAKAYGEAGRVDKSRTLYLVGRTRVHLDKVEGLGLFVELEVVLRDGEPETAGHAEALALISKLGISSEQLIDRAYVDLLTARPDPIGATGAPSLQAFVSSIARSALAPWGAFAPWELTSRSTEIVRTLISDLPREEWFVKDEVAVHRSAVVEAGARLIGPLLVGPRSRVTSGALVRGGCWMGEGCVVGHGSELKSSFLFDGSSLAHLNFVGDSVIGAGVNFEAGAIVCNSRNERLGGPVHAVWDGRLVEAGAKFGALVGDGCRIGANATIAPGALLTPGLVVVRGGLVDDEAHFLEARA